MRYAASATARKEPSLRVADGRGAAAEIAAELDRRALCRRPVCLPRRRRVPSRGVCSCRQLAAA